MCLHGPAECLTYSAKVEQWSSTNVYCRQLALESESVAHPPIARGQVAGDECNGVVAERRQHVCLEGERRDLRIIKPLLTQEVDTGAACSLTAAFLLSDDAIVLGLYRHFER